MIIMLLAALRRGAQLTQPGRVCSKLLPPAPSAPRAAREISTPPGENDRSAANRAAFWARNRQYNTAGRRAARPPVSCPRDERLLAPAFEDLPAPLHS